MDPVKMPIEDTLDLHTFHPKDVPDLLHEYFRSCMEAGIFSVRVIHGKGLGHLKKRVQTVLAKVGFLKTLDGDTGHFTTRGYLLIGPVPPASRSLFLHSDCHN